MEEKYKVKTEFHFHFSEVLVEIVFNAEIIFRYTTKHIPRLDEHIILPNYVEPKVAKYKVIDIVHAFDARLVSVIVGDATIP